MEQQREASRIIRRQRILLAVATAAAVIATGGLGASLLVKSPAQRAADQQPPPASQVTATVTKEKLTRVLVVRGRIIATAVDVNALPLAGNDRLVLTGLPIPVGSPVKSGAVVAQVSGRPVIVWQSAVPFYRDIKPGMSGPDVDALRAAMAKNGETRARSTGAPFDSELQTAVARHYKNQGYSALTTDDLDPSSKAARRDATRAVTAARRAVTDASDPTAKKRAQEDLRAAQETLAALGTGVVIPLGEIAAAPRLPSVVAAVKAAPGTDLTATSEHTILSIATGAPVVQATAPLGEKDALAVGQDVMVEDEVTGKSTACTITSIKPPKSVSSGAQPAGDPATENDLTLTLTPASGSPLATDQVGNEVRASISLKSSGDKVTSVPLNAISTSDDGSTTVTVVMADGTQKKVPVRVGLATETRVEITPLTGDLADGDTVLIP